MLSNFHHLPGKDFFFSKSLSCVSAVLGAGRDALSALTEASASGPQANGSLRVYKQQAAEGASSFYGVFPKEAELSLPQRDYPDDLHSSGGQTAETSKCLCCSASAGCVNKKLFAG